MMQGLWSRAVSTQSSCRCVSCLSTTASGVTSRSGAAASRRRLRIGNSVTALYTSIFAAATLADAKYKVERRQEWEEKIAAVKAEVKDLQDQDQIILESLLLGRRAQGTSRVLLNRTTRRAGSFPPTPITQYRPTQLTRSFHTNQTLDPVQRRKILNRITSERGQGTQPSLATKEENLEATDNDYEDELLEEEIVDYNDELNHRNGHLPDWVLEDPLRIKAIQTLALRQFGLRLILRPRIAHRYTGIDVNFERDVRASRAMMPNVRTTKLLWDVDRLRQRIRDLQKDVHSTYDDIIKGFTSTHPEILRDIHDNLDHELDKILDGMINGKTLVDEGLMHIAMNIFRSVEPDRPYAFSKIMTTFTYMHQNDVNDLLLRCLLPHMFLLDPTLISAILALFRKTRNFKHMDLFLQLIAGEGWSVNLGPQATLYERTLKDGHELIKPPNDLRPVDLTIIYSELIGSALLFDQPQRADALFDIAKRHCSIECFNTLQSYLRYYSINRNWPKGIQVLRRAADWLTSTRDLPAEGVERLIVLMVHLCDSNKKKFVARTLINAAIDSGFGAEIPVNQPDLESTIDPKLVRWQDAAEFANPVKATVEETMNRPVTEKYADFARLVSDYLTSLAKPKETLRGRGSSSVTEGNKTSLQDDPHGPFQGDTQSEVSFLRNELARMRKLLAAARNDRVESSSPEGLSEHAAIQPQIHDKPAPGQTLPDHIPPESDKEGSQVAEHILHATPLNSPATSASEDAQIGKTSLSKPEVPHEGMVTPATCDQAVESQLSSHPNTHDGGPKARINRISPQKSIVYKRVRLRQSQRQGKGSTLLRFGSDD